MLITVDVIVVVVTVTVTVTSITTLPSIITVKYHVNLKDNVREHKVQHEPSALG